MSKVEDGDAEVLVTTLKEHIEKDCRETVFDGNGENPALQEWVTVPKSQIMETLSTNTETWWKDYIGHTGRATRSKPATTVTVDLCFNVKPTVNDII